MKRYLPFLLTAALAGCGESEPPPPVVVEDAAPVSWGDAPEVEAAEAQVFLRKPVPEAGPGRVMLHVLVAAGATEDQIRLALSDVLARTAEADTTVLALRAVAYVAPPVQAGEVELVPAGWAEWVPPQGWAGATAASRREFHRIYTYFGAAPPW